jgi:hypothetical protein
MNVNTINTDLSLDLKLPNLLPGPIGKAAHKAKADRLLGLTYLTQVISVPVAQLILGAPGRPSTNSNTNAFLKKLVSKQLMRELWHEPNEFNMSGRVFMLTEAGLIRAQSVVQLPELHDYNLNPESVRRSQLAHDLAVAQIAAVFLVHGAKIVATDLSQRTKFGRSEQRHVKLPDLVVEVSGQRIAIEIERAPKNRREVDQALLLASRSQHLPTIWLVNARVTKGHLEAGVASGLINQWKLSSEHKWSPCGKALLPMNFRRKQTIAPLTPATLNRAPQKWLAQVSESAASFDDRVGQGLRKLGWEWTLLQADPSHHGGAFFELHHRPSGESFIVSTQADGIWVMCRQEQTLVDGKRLRFTSKHWAGEAGPPSLTLISEAISETDLDLPPYLRDR